MAALKLYLLRETSGLMSEKPLYLTRIARRGLTAHYHLSPDMGRRFTAAQKAAFKAAYPYMRGRFVLYDKEVMRRLKEQS